MVLRFFRPLLALLTLVLALSLTAAPAQAFAFSPGAPEKPRAVKAQKERGLFFSLLVRLFGKSGGGMDPNGSGPLE
ncbi:MAG TPA: hypothetical protein VHN15_14455 [Thermoanaerobaculia bacterium]|nr:hypothetical protein [Thermoanaerobaculia bacterium]